MSQRRTQRTPPPRQRRRGPNWGVVVVFIGIGVGAVLLGTWQTVLQPAIHASAVRARASTALVDIDQWPPVVGTSLESEPVLTELEDGRLQFTVTYVGKRTIDDANAVMYCASLHVPRGWESIQCGISSKDPPTFTIVVRESD